MARKSLALVVLALAVVMARAVETVGVDGSDVKFPSEIQATVADKPVKLTLTGAALRKRFIFSVYAIASYVKEGAAIRTAEDLASCDSPKQLHLVLERDVKGTEMAEALRTAIRQNYDDPQFANEIKSLVDFMGKFDVKKGDNVRLTHVPGRGLIVSLEGKAQIVIETPTFSKAVWDIYLGKNNLGDPIKKALVSRL